MYNNIGGTMKNKIIELNNITGKDIDTISSINDNDVIKFNFENYEAVLMFISIMRLKSKNNRCIISITDKKSFDSIISKDNYYSLDNIYVELQDSAFSDVSLKTYLRCEQEFYNLITPAINLSPFEKFLYAYNITKNYKEYKKSSNSIDSRNIYKLVDNDYMVCVGYCNLLINLLSKLGIESSFLDVYVGNNIENDEEIESIEKYGHSRVIVRLIDSKYNIDGIYLSDPTYDNNLNHDYYNHALVTFNEFNLHDNPVFSKSPFYENQFNTLTIDQLFSIQSIEEFYEKINIILNRNHNLNEKSVISILLIKIRNFDKKFYNEIKNKYNDLSPVQDIFYDIGNYLLEKTNKPIDGYQIRDGITNLYRLTKNYSIDELQDKINTIMKDNADRDEIAFPYGTIEKSDGSTEYINEINKFDLEDTQIKK